MSLQTRPSPSATHLQAGFSLIEVLVTMLIISLAVLGAAGMQANTIRLNQAGQFRTQAVILAADLAERMQANSVGATLGNYVLPTSSTRNTLSTACSVSNCNPTNLAAYDLSQWQNNVAAALPNSSWSVVQTTAGNPSTYTITISWVDRMEKASYAAYNASAAVGSTSDGTGERFYYTATRLIYN